MAVGHAKDIVSLLHEIGSEHAAALPGNIDAQLLYGLDGIRAGRLAFHGPEPGR